MINKGDNENWWICDNGYVDNNVKVRYYCDITGEYRGSAHRDYNINLELNHIIPVVFQNIKDYVSQLIMDELDTSNLKRSVAPNGPEKYVSFTVNDKLNFIDSFQFPSS